MTPRGTFPASIVNWCFALSRTGALLRLFALFICSLALCTDAALAVSGTTSPRKVRVGYCMGYGIISATGGVFTGYGYDYLQEIAKYTDWEYEYVPGNWTELLAALERGDIDLLGPVQFTEARSKLFVFPRNELGFEHGVLYARADNSSLFSEDFEGYDGINMGFVRGAFYNVVFDEYQKRNGFEVLNHIYNTPEALMLALENGDVDALVGTNLLDIPNVKLLARFGGSPYYFAVQPHRPELAEQMDKAIMAIRENTPYFTLALQNRYFSFIPGYRPAYTREEDKFIRSTSPLRVAVLNNWPPMGTLSKTGDVVGIVPDLLRQISRESRLPLELVGVESIAAAESGVRTGEIDLVACYSAANASLAQGLLHVTEDYMQIPLMLLGRHDLASTRGMRVALPMGFELQEAVKRSYKDAVFLPYDTFEACFAAVRNNEADACLMLSYLYDMYAGTSEFEDFTYISNIDRPLGLALGVSSQLPPTVLSIMKKSFAEISSADINETLFVNTSRQGRTLSLSIIIQEFYKEIMAVAGALTMLVTLLYALLRSQHEQRLWTMAYIDTLTSYANWNKFELDAPNIRTKYPCAMVVIDIEFFKMVNDYFGYAAGSKTLCLMAAILQAELEEDEIAARRGSDIFVLLLRYSDTQTLHTRLISLQERIAGMRVSVETDRHLLHTICGVAFDEPNLSLHSLFDRANHARKSLKPAHKNACAFFDSTMNAHVQEELEIEQRMEQALCDGEFQVYLQPKFDLATETIMGAEALIRWNIPGSGMVGPNTFIPLFEKNSFILKLDMFVLEEVCRLLRHWMDLGRTPVPVAVNISRVHLYTADFVSNIYTIVHRYGVPTHLVELELTETAFFSNTTILLDVMQELRSLGFTLALDDFGSGYSSLNMLKSLPVDVLKLDGGFFAMGDDKERGWRIINSVIAMAQGLNMKVVSEGVETLEQVNQLRIVGCDYVQGYYFSRPLPIDQFEARLFGE